VPDELDISEQQDHPVLGEKEDEEQRGGDPGEPGPKPPEEPVYGSDPDLRERLREFVKERERPSRQDELWPYLLVRAFAGDAGRRAPPLGWFWESPDVIVVPGVVDSLEGNTPTLTPRAGEDHTVFVRTWNLGRLPAPATKVRAWWANPAFGFPDGVPQYIGGATVDLEDQYHFPACRAVVRIPEPWVPEMVNGGHECLLAKVDGFADRAASGWQAGTQRHVGQRNLTVLAPETDMTLLLDLLTMTMPWNAEVHLVHGMGAVTDVIAAQGADFAERFGFGAPDELPGQAVPLEDGQGHLGAVSLSDGEVGFISGEEAASLLFPRGERPEGGEYEQGGPEGVLAEFLRHTFDVDPTAGALAQQLGGDRAHLLRFAAFRQGHPLGGYSVVVTT